MSYSNPYITPPQQQMGMNNMNMNMSNYMSNRPYQYYDNSNLSYMKGRPVSSLDEVKAIPIDFDGSVFYFPDLANKRIYTKQIAMDGSAQLNMYELKEIPRETPSNQVNPSYITREEFEKVIAELKAYQAKEQAAESKRTVDPQIIANF